MINFLEHLDIWCHQHLAVIINISIIIIIFIHKKTPFTDCCDIFIFILSLGIYSSERSREPIKWFTNATFTNEHENSQIKEYLTFGEKSDAYDF